MNVKLNLGGAKKAALGHPWIQVKDLEHFRQLPPAGEIVRLQDSVGNFMAHAVSDGPGAEVPYRILSRERHPAFDAAWFAAAVEAALKKRQALMQEDAGVRLIHGEADGLPGLTCERHGGALWTAFHSPGLRAFQPLIEAALRSAGRAPGSSTLRSRVAGLGFYARLEREEPADFSLEQRLNYARLGELGLKGEALILFSRAGAWAAAALRAGCSTALCLDRDREANARAAENLALNGFESRAELSAEGALERLDRLAAGERRFGFVMADLPARAAGARMKFQASHHTQGLAERAFKLLAPGGVAAFSLPASELSLQGFASALERAAAKAGVAAQPAVAGRLAQDFPELPGFDAPRARRFLALSFNPGLGEN